MLRSNIHHRSTLLSRVSASSIASSHSIRMSSSIPKTSNAMHSQVPENVIGYAKDDVLFTNKNLSRVITLNRPQKLNSLNTSMVSKITPRLLEYAKSNVNNLIILNSNSPKGLCAGGDVAECAKQIKEGNPEYGSDFFQREYNLNYLISTYSKPYVSIMDGITMGGGVGLSVHAPFRISTEKTKLAMPEMDIGFFPDVGTTFFLPRLDDKLGYYYALTGEILTGLDAYFAGFATHYIPSDRISSLVNRLSNLQPPALNDQTPSQNHTSVLESSSEYFTQVNHAIEEYTETTLPKDYQFPLSQDDLSLVNQAFSSKTIEEALNVFKQHDSEFAKKTFAKLSSKSPTSLRVAFELLNRGARNDIRKQFELELITATNIMHNKIENNDFFKGVNHKLIEKIKQPFFPEWTSLEPLGKDYINKLFEKSISTSKLSNPLIEQFFGLTYKDYPYNMGLPNNKQVQNYITGNDGSNRSYLPTPNEVYKHFKTTYNDKLGLKNKIDKILALHGEASKYDDKYVSWKN